MKRKIFNWLGVALMMLFSANAYAGHSKNYDHITKTYAVANNTDLSNVVKITDAKITDANGNVITDLSGPYESANYLYFFNFNWDLTSLGGTISEGDYFTIQLPDAFSPYNDSTHNIVSNSIVVGRLTINKINKTLTITFNENAEFMANFNGNVAVPVYVNLTEGENVIVLPDGSTQKILYTRNVGGSSGSSGEVNKTIYEGEILAKQGWSTYRNYILWNVFINVSKQDFGTSEVVIEDNVKTSSGTPISIMQNTFILKKGVIINNLSTARTSNYQVIEEGSIIIPVTQDENEYRDSWASGKEMAFLKIQDGGESFRLYLGNNVGDNSYYLTYQTTLPEDQTGAVNGAKIVVDDKDTLPYISKNGEAPTSNEVSANAFIVRLPNTVTYADLKNRITLYKYDSEDGTQLSDAVFKLTYPNGTEVNLTTGSNGSVQSAFLDAGTYTLTEITAPNGYQLLTDPISVEVVYNQPTIVRVPNTKISTVETRTFTANKVWLENGTTTHPTITLVLQKDGVDYLSAERKYLANGETTATWDNIPVYNTDGTKAVYTAREVSVEGYNTLYKHTEDTTTITNVAENYTRSFNVNKVWVGGEDVRPTITLVLQRNGEDLAGMPTRQLANGESVATWNYLLVMDNTGNEYTYSVREVEVSNYVATYEHTSEATTITNTYVVPTPTHCELDPMTRNGALSTPMGITTLGRAGAGVDTTNPEGWPMLRKGGWIALESNNKGFVPTRTTPDKITNPQNGMMIYDTSKNCLSIYDGTKWTCFSTPACPK